MESMKRITIDLPDEIYQELKIRCATANISMSEVVRELLNKILKGKSMEKDFFEFTKKSGPGKFYKGLKKSSKKS
jgi:plasmid stability protein